MEATHFGRTSWLDEQIVVVATPHFKQDWDKSRYGKSRTKTLTQLMGSWLYPRQGFYEDLLSAPLGQTMYAVVRRKSNLKSCAFIYFRNIKNDKRGGRREMELISVTPPIRGQTEGINFETFHDHRDTEEWCSIVYSW